MNERTGIRMQEIRRRTRRRRQKFEICALSCLGVIGLLLIAGIGILLTEVQTAGIAQVNSAYSSVLLRQGTVEYIVIGTTAFVLGAAVTIIFIRLRKKM